MNIESAILEEMVGASAEARRRSLNGAHRGLSSAVQRCGPDRHYRIFWAAAMENSRPSSPNAPPQPETPLSTCEVEPEDLELSVTSYNPWSFFLSPRT